MKTLAIVLSALFLTGCGTLQKSKFAVRQGSEIATVVALQQMEATKDEAVKVYAISIQSRDVIEAGGEIDSDALKAEIIGVINKNFEPKDRLILMLLLNSIVEFVMHELERDPIPSQRDVLVLVRAAADGVASGANLYILSLDEPKVRMLNVNAIRWPVLSEVDPLFKPGSTVTIEEQNAIDLIERIRSIRVKLEILMSIDDPEEKKKFRQEIYEDMGKLNKGF